MPDLSENHEDSENMDPKAVNVITFEESDLKYEEDILRNAYSIKCWTRYIDHKKDRKAPATEVYLVYERALKQLPGSYKLWYNYLKFRRTQARTLCTTDPIYEAVNACFERALVFMHKMPRIWLDYSQFLMDQQYITRTRKVFNRSLRALPITQHERIWPLYLKFVRSHQIPETALRVYRRYLKLKPDAREDFVQYLLEIDRLNDAAVELAVIVNFEKFVSKEGKTNHQLWHELCELISKNPSKVTSLKVEPIIRQGIKRYTDEVGKLWCSLADYFIRGANFEKARDIYEEAIQTVQTVRDFTQVFDAYAQFEERAAGSLIEECSDKIGGPTIEEDVEIELRLARFEYLMDRRPILLNSVLLRQNPHNVHEWHKRVQLFEDNPAKVVETYTEAVQTVDPKLQTGRLSSLWIAFAKYYETKKQLQDARSVFERALHVNFSKVDDLASVWCEFAELELRINDPEAAIKLMKRATAQPPQKTNYFDESETVQRRVYKSLKLWSMYADLQESFADYQSAKSVYDRMIDLKIATPQIIINFGMFLEEQNHFEESFKAYEKGISIFKWPNVFDIWNTYLVKFIKRYGAKKLERARDLFEQCCEHIPKKYAKTIYLMYAKLEEEHGLARHAMTIYSRAVTAVDEGEMDEVFNVYIKKAAELYGVTHTRPIYERAIDILPEDRSRDMCLRFAELEKKLGEIDRARAVYAHCSQMCDPRVHMQFWETWKEFEIKHGNEDTVREMLRVKRSVQATYNTQVNFMSAQMLAAEGIKTTADLSAGDSMALLEAKAQQMAQEEAKAQANEIHTPHRNVTGNTGSSISFVRGSASEGTKKTMTTANPDEINIDDEDNENENDDDEDVTMEKQAIPSEVFGSLAKEDD